MPAYVLVAILVIAAIVFAVPVRRLALDGRSGALILGYVLILAALAFGVSEARPLARYLLPLLGLAYIAPFFTPWSGIDRLLGRRPPAIRVTPAPIRSIAPSRDAPPDAPAGATAARDVTPPASAPAPEDGGPGSDEPVGPDEPVDPAGRPPSAPG